MAEPRLDGIARACRVQIIRMLTHAGSGHPGGSLSVIDELVSIMFGRLRHDPTRSRPRSGWTAKASRPR